MAIDRTQSHGTSVLLLARVRDRDERAAEAIFSRYFSRLTSFARSRLSRRVAGRTDPEDIVMSVYRSFFVGARAGRFTLGRRGDLWRLLASITKHKLLRAIRYHQADRRSVEIEQVLDSRVDGRLPGRQRDLSPHDAAALADQLESVRSKLDPFGRSVLELRLQGTELTEIATNIGRSERTVRRVLSQVRQILEERSAREKEDAPLLSHRDFLLERMIGAGQMGKVYQAWHQSASRPVAVKFLRKSYLSQPGIVERFIGEARTVARLDHPNIVSVHGLGRTPGGSYFIVMKLVNGPNLDQIMRSRAITVVEAMRCTIETCRALEHAHARGVIHCDLKPANLLLDDDGTIRVTDFGLARSRSEHTPWTAQVEGTAPFMAPEQASRRWGEIDVRTDVYGIGAVLFTLLTGRPPWVGRGLSEILAAVVSGTPVISPAAIRADLPRLLSDVCQRCLSKASTDRYSTVQELRLALSKLITEC